MKKFLVCAAMIAAMFLTVSCGGGSSSDDNNSGDNNASQLCHYGEYKCDGGNSYFCGYMDSGNDLTWKFAEQCSNGCDSVTGKCSEGSNSNENENNNGDSDYPAADNSYNANYGFISLNFSFDGIGNADDSDFTSDNYAYGTEEGDAYATGTYGNGSAAINPANASTFVKHANYYSSENLIDIQQMPVFLSDGEYIGGNPVVMLQINANQASVGNMSVGLNEEDVALYVVEVNWSTHQIKCIHAFAEGQTNISKLGDLLYHGALQLTGALQLYSPKNYKGNDVSSVFNFSTCPAVY